MFSDKGYLTVTYLLMGNNLRNFLVDGNQGVIRGRHFVIMLLCLVTLLQT